MRSGTITNERAIQLLEHIRRIGNGESEYKNDAQAIALDMAIEALQEHKTGRWIRRHSKMWECSECERGCRWRENYCPDCGAKMEVDE